MTALNGVHILLTYRCLSTCDHCFVWGSPQQTAVFTRENLLHALDQAGEVPSIRTVYFEGGEPFLFYPLLVEGARAAAARGFSVGIVSNGYWGSSVEDARLWLAPFVGLLSDLSISTDRLHTGTDVSPESRSIMAACRQLGIPGQTLSCQTEDVQFRGRAASLLSAQAPKRPWSSFDECPHEDLEAPGRVHLDPAGNLHLCQGLVMGNLFDRPLKEILDSYEAAAHPIAAPLTAGGPAELVRVYDLPHAATYADACHLCYTARDQLRERFPVALAPDAMYGVGLT